MFNNELNNDSVNIAC